MLLFERIRKKIKENLGTMELKEFLATKKYFDNKYGIEIGGPSGIFKPNNILPVYGVARRVDGVNFAGYTVWENIIKAGQTYVYTDGKVGEQYIMEASELTGIPNNKYDFLLASHCLEHCANAIYTLNEWQRVVKPGGVLLLALPDQRVTFDRNRLVTTFDHLLEDFKNKVGEDDLTHLDEILTLHDLSRDPGVADKNAFDQRSQLNHENRCLHHHVFDLQLLCQVFEYLDLEVLFTAKFLPSLVICGRKRPS